MFYRGRRRTARAEFRQRRTNLDLSNNAGERRRYTNLKLGMIMDVEALATWDPVCGIRMGILVGDIEIGGGVFRWS